MKIYEFYNRSNNYVEVIDQNGNVVVFKPRETKRLSEYFLRYTPKILVLIKQVKIDGTNFDVIQKPKTFVRRFNQRFDKIVDTKYVKTKKVQRTLHRLNIDTKHKISKNVQIGKIRRGSNVQKVFNESIQEFDYGISNNIGVGILSFNRLDSLKRLINSIREHTDLSKTKVFVSDESTDNNVKKWLDEQSDIIFINNKERLGIAGNTNRLLQALNRFENILILNDDVEILNDGWENFYFEAMAITGFKHFNYRQIGIYGADSQGSPKTINGRILYRIDNKPHGAVLAFKHEVIEKIGYFNEEFNDYGMEHVDYSRRVYLAKMQPEGFYDVAGSDKYFLIHAEHSVGSKASLPKNRKLYDDNNKIKLYCDFSDRSKLDGISVIIPMRYTKDRVDSLYTVINNIRAQHFPIVEIIVCEEDKNQKFDINKAKPIKYKFIKSNNKFNKCAAFNYGIVNAKFEKLVLHDGDILVPLNYINVVNTILSQYDSCHIGARVLYLDKNSTQKVNSTGILRNSIVTHMVGTLPANGKHETSKFIGGSICANKSVLMKIGGFDENFVGWGEEDLAFYKVLQFATKMYDDRFINFVHLYHKQSSEVYNKRRNNLNYYKSIKINKNYIRSLREKFRKKYDI